jgi:MoxR-like ATPase
VKPAAGFNVIATANTKGKGSDDGRFIGTNVLNEAFLERFALTFEQEYPPASIETRILNKICDDQKFCARLADWADIIRKTFKEGGVDEVISTRRLVHIINAYKIFDDKVKAINLGLNRFDDETKQAFMSLYDAVDADVDVKTEV